MIAVVVLAQILFAAFYGLGGYPTSEGVYTETQTVAKVVGAQVVGPNFFNYPGGTQVEPTIRSWRAANPSGKIVLFGYSCGNETITRIPQDMPDIKFDGVVGIQASEWPGCVPLQLTPNIMAAQLTYNPSCLITFFFGCAVYQPGPGFPGGRLTTIQRPDSHGYADLDPDAQNDVTDFVKRVAAAPANAFAALGPNSKPRLAIRYHGQHL